ncbi:MAG: TonB-dependent receptor [Mediterranea sp.]|jgi:TonB-linked SusC/RagA family outer membrane protein|nr:TonB-dependent receptor [Mediterranea sp.]
MIRPLGLLFLLCFVPLWTFAQTITVTGVVNDPLGEPVIGASVLEQGTTNGTITDIDGNFTLKVSPQGRLVISFIGYQSQTLAVEGKTHFSVVLRDDTQLINEVVVIGYGTQRKSDVTGSIASVRGEELRAVQTGNISSALQGRVAGVDMQQTSSRPGASMQIRVRGTRSLTASNDPLVVLDGIPFAGSLSDINPSDIKSMDILKDASSTAIYGSRGANGVIMITTDKGIMGQKATVNYNAYFGVKSAQEYPMMNNKEFIALRKAAGKYSNNLDEDDNVNTDWQDLFYQTGLTQSHDISVQGGGSTNSYSLGAGYYNEKGVVPTQGFDRLSLRASIDQEIGKYVKVGVVSNSTYNVTQGSQIGTYGILSMAPIVNPYNEDGSLKRVVKMATDDQFVITKSVVKGLADTWLNESKVFGSYNNIFGEIKAPWVEGLKYRANLGLNFRATTGGAFTGQGVNSTNATTESSASISNSWQTNWTIENLLTYDNTFAEKHRVSLTGMYSAEQTTYNKSAVSAKNIPAEYFQYYNLGQALGTITVDPGKQGYQQYGLMSWMGRAMYAYDDKYMASVAFRSDASSRLAKGHQWHTYPAVSIGWNIAKEEFMGDYTPIIDQLKLRVGYGETSNQSIDPYKTLGALTSRPYNFGSAFATGYYVSELPSPELGWEYSRTWNYGLDFSLLNHRIWGTFEFYVQNTLDLLQSVKLPKTGGVGSYTANFGTSRNTGFELSLNGTIIENKNGWSWDAGINFYHNDNELTSLASGAKYDKDNSWFTGHPIDVIYDYQKVGIWNESDPDYQYMQILEPGGNVGMIKVKYTGDRDATGKPLRAINADDRQVIDLEPDFQGGFNTRVAYKDWDLSIVGAYKGGGILISTLYSSTGYLNMMTGRRGNVKIDYWTPENTGAKYPKPGGIEQSDNPKYGSTLGRFDASYLKVRTITLGYNVPKNVLSKFGLSNLRLYASVQNPFVFFSPYYDESGCDPDTNSLGDENQAVTTSLPPRLLIVGTNAPSTRNFLIGLNLSF